MNTIPRGIYQHYKGQQYEVLGCAHHSETEELLVVYRALYGDYGLWVRPFTIFFFFVVVDGETLPRFRLLHAHEHS